MKQMIKHLERITHILPDFSLEDISYIIDLHYYLDMKHVRLHDHETIPMVEIVALVLGDEQNYEVQMRFTDVEGLQVEYLSFRNPLPLELVKRGEDYGWEKEYEIRSVQEDEFQLLCNEIEILSIKESSILVK